MLRSLVGSEMCIRDSQRAVTVARGERFEKLTALYVDQSVVVL